MNRVNRNKNKDYTVVSNVFLRDKNLSLKAKGFLAVVMGLPDDWEFTINGICAILKEGKTSIYSTINELKDNGYCKVEICRNEKGVILGNDYSFFETPNSEKQYNEKPYSENPNMDNQPQLNTYINNNLNNKVNNNKEDTIVSKKEDIDYNSVLSAWNKVASNVDTLSKIRGLNDKRKSCIKNLIKNCKTSVEEIVKVINTIPYADDWVLGKGNRQWTIDFDFLVKNTSNWYVKALEGGLHKNNLEKFNEMMGNDNAENSQKGNLVIGGIEYR